jgi:hypothetical protein
VQYNARNFENAAIVNQDSLQVGFAYWMLGHNRSIKVSAGRLHCDNQPDRKQVLAQFQVFSY